MPNFTLIAYETVKLTRTVTAASIATAYAQYADDPEAEWDEQTLGTAGLERILDADGNTVYASDGSDQSEPNS